MIRSARFVNELDVVLFSLSDVICNSWSDFMCVAGKLQISVVSDNEDWVSCTFKQIVLVFESSYYCQEFPMIYRVVLFGCGEGLGVVAISAKHLVSLLILKLFVSLGENCTHYILGGIDF
jgi:hypothetical protein